MNYRLIGPSENIKNIACLNTPDVYSPCPNYGGDAGGDEGKDFVVHVEGKGGGRKVRVSASPQGKQQNSSSAVNSTSTAHNASAENHGANSSPNSSPEKKSRSRRGSSMVFDETLILLVTGMWV